MSNYFPIDFLIAGQPLIGYLPLNLSLILYLSCMPYYHTPWKVLF